VAAVFARIASSCSSGAVPEDGTEGIAISRMSEPVFGGGMIAAMDSSGMLVGSTRFSKGRAVNDDSSDITGVV
jgi:hypothetical protein